MQTNFHTKPYKRFYFIQNSIIFNISSLNPTDDPCAQLIGDETTKDKLPSINVEYYGETTSTDTYYLDDLIKDGDNSGTTEGTCAFKKRIHESEESNKSYIEYLKDESEKTIINIIKQYPLANNETLRNRIKQNIPEFMYKEYFDGTTDLKYEITSSTEINNVGSIQIDLTDTYINSKKEEAVKEEIYNNAVRTANNFGFTLTKPSDTSGIEITKNN